jgi:hypothetical protein
MDSSFVAGARAFSIRSSRLANEWSALVTRAKVGKMVVSRR